MGCPDGGRKNPAIADHTLALLRQGFFLIKIREKIYWGMTSFNRLAGSVLLAALFWSEQSCSDNFGKLAHPTKMGSTEICKKRAEEAHTRAEQSVYSPRAREGFPVAAPVTWAQVERGIRPDAFTIARAPPAAQGSVREA